MGVAVQQIHQQRYSSSTAAGSAAAGTQQQSSQVMQIPDIRTEVVDK
jgi:hypothetical protein